MARANRDFVIGFIAQQRMDAVGLQEGESSPDEDFLILTPGVGLDTRGDSMGQQYRAPREVIMESGCDVIIVGRGVYGKDNGENVEAVRAQAERYRIIRRCQNQDLDQKWRKVVLFKNIALRITHGIPPKQGMKRSAILAIFIK